MGGAAYVMHVYAPPGAAESRATARRALRADRRTYYLGVTRRCESLVHVKWLSSEVMVLPHVYEMVNAPTATEYVRGMTALGARITDDHIRVFQAHYGARDRTATSKQLASWTTLKWPIVVNRLYGGLGHAFCDTLGIRPELRPDGRHRWWSVWCRGWDTPGGFIWQMLPQVAQALEQLDWASPAGFVSPDEVPSGIVILVEGATRRVTVNAYERHPEARRRCIRAHGTNCAVCGFNFGAVYGAEAEGYIHVHHLRPLSEIGCEHEFDPVEDLRPVCPNCHAVLHLQIPCRSIEEVRAALALTSIRSNL